MLNLDFYTIRTEVELDDLHVDLLNKTVGLFCSPDIVSKKVKKTKSTYTWKFAVREHGLRSSEDALLNALPEPFNRDNTRIIRADDI